MHLRRRPGPSGRGVVASAVLLLSLTACSPDAVTIEAYDLSAADRTTCQALVDDLPDTLAGQARTSLDANSDGLGAAWGDPAYVLTCGVPEPGAYEPTDECNVIADVGWWVPDDQMQDLGEDAGAIALSLTPYVEVKVPARYRTDGIDRALAELAPALEEHLAAGRSCL